MPIGFLSCGISGKQPTLGLVLSTLASIPSLRISIKLFIFMFRAIIGSKVVSNSWVADLIRLTVPEQKI